MRSIFIKKDIEKIKNRISEIKKLIEEMEINEVKKEKINNQEENEGIEQLETPIIETEIKKQSEKQITKPVLKEINQKEIVKEEILKIIREKNLTSKEIKKELVDERKICSKASFYRYLSELKKENEIETIKINQEEFLYKK